jgi:hypothetical protein
VSLPRYLLLKTFVGFGVFIVMAPIFFLVATTMAQFLNENSSGLLPFFVGIPFLIVTLGLTHWVTEKLSQRWSR